MAVTQLQNCNKRGILNDHAFPVASGEYIYQGTIAIVKNDGYLYNLTAAVAAAGDAGVIGFVENDSLNRNATAPSANGSISGDRNEGSGPSNGERTIRRIWTSGEFRVKTATGLTQASVGKTLYATDNFTFSASATAGVPVGTIVKYISATECWVELNSFINENQTVTVKGAITAATTTTGGDAISWANPAGADIIVTDMIVDVTTPATGAATIDIGVAADGTTTSDTIFDGVDIGTAAILFNATSGNGGTNGKLARKMTSTQYITGTPSATLAGLVGTYEITFKRS